MFPLGRGNVTGNSFASKRNNRQKVALEKAELERFSYSTMGRWKRCTEECLGNPIVVVMSSLMVSNLIFK